MRYTRRNVLGMGAMTAAAGLFGLTACSGPARPHRRPPRAVSK